MLPIVWLPEAEADAREWPGIARSAPSSAIKFALAIEATMGAITENPLRFPVVYRSRRRAGVRRFPTDSFLRSRLTA